MARVGFCGVTPLRLSAVSVSAATLLGCHMTGSLVAR